jgi:hypothetical protein
MVTSSLWADDVAVAARMRAALEGALVERRVDLALWGHVHMWEGC